MPSPPEDIPQAAGRSRRSEEFGFLFHRLHRSRHGSCIEASRFVEIADNWVCIDSGSRRPWCHVGRAPPSVGRPYWPRRWRPGALDAAVKVVELRFFGGLSEAAEGVENFPCDAEAGLGFRPNLLPANSEI